MSEFLYHAPCPNCGSKDNLGIYNDHEYCFGCGYTKHYNPLAIKREGVVTKPHKQIWIPDDIEANIPAVAHEWLLKYGLTRKELLDNKVVWSDRMKLLVFMYVKQGLLLGWQGRYFGNDNSKPKWWSQGNLKEIDHVIGDLDSNGSIILVEDIVSAIKVGRQYPCKPLFGSYIDISTIYNKYNNKDIYIWLDNDKYKEAHKFSIKLNNIGVSTKVIHTLKDPKELSDEQIRIIYESKTSNYSSSTRPLNLVGVQAICTS